MWMNVLLGLLIPWGILIYLFMKSPLLVILMYPLGVTIAFVANDWGFDLVWEVKPIYNNPSLSAIPISLGYFPMVTSIFAYVREKTLIDIWTLILSFSLLTTFIEFLVLWSGKIHYYNGWNILWTYVTYLAGFIVVHVYVNILKKYHTPL
ncbi:hypothetical protein [Thalassobacillus devorans]|uniref:hypothetical protein n=1 Tax=Thalassobacillus devorans TaxID=279813 RepID=UPI00048D65EA|nr:hypothetical protein [Thalassobacillus devorans]